MLMGAKLKGAEWKESDIVKEQVLSVIPKLLGSIILHNT